MTEEEKKDETQPQEAEKQTEESHQAEESRTTAAAKDAAGAAKAASKDAFEAFRLLITDPVARLPEACEKLGDTRGMAAGIVFGVVYALSHALKDVMSGASGVLSLTVLGLIIVGTAQFMGLALGGLLVRWILRGEGNLRRDLFIAGAVLLPMAASHLLQGISQQSPVIVKLALVLGMTFSVLMLYSASTEINKISKRAASLMAVPVMGAVAVAIGQVVSQIQIF